MTKKGAQRKKEFMAALALLGETQAEWAIRHGITPGHLSHILCGRRESGRVDGLMDAYINEFRAAVARRPKAA
jgi:hypothetical protein